LNIKRYEIYSADLNPTVGSEIKKVRPVVIISQDEMNKYLETVVVCPLTSKLHPQWRTRLQIKCANKHAERQNTYALKVAGILRQIAMGRLTQIQQNTYIL
jgi:mRNA-degrading endonuclease toxin of MazEF toxin-antitoxin module